MFLNLKFYTRTVELSGFLSCSCGFLNIFHFVIQSTLEQCSDTYSAQCLALQYVPQGTRAPSGLLKQSAFPF